MTLPNGLQNLTGFWVEGNEAHTVYEDQWTKKFKYKSNLDES